MNDGGPAFPRPWTGPSKDNGMSLRDYFAAAALTGLLTEHLSSGEEFNTTTKMDAVGAAIAAYIFADAMLYERAKSK